MCISRQDNPAEERRQRGFQAARESLLRVVDLLILNVLEDIVTLRTVALPRVKVELGASLRCDRVAGKDTLQLTHSSLLRIISLDAREHDLLHDQPPGGSAIRGFRHLREEPVVLLLSGDAGWREGQAASHERETIGSHERSGASATAALVNRDQVSARNGSEAEQNPHMSEVW